MHACRHTNTHAHHGIHTKNTRRIEKHIYNERTYLPGMADASTADQSDGRIPQSWWYTASCWAVLDKARDERRRPPKASTTTALRLERRRCGGGAEEEEDFVGGMVLWNQMNEYSDEWMIEWMQEEWQTVPSLCVTERGPSWSDRQDWIIKPTRLLELSSSKKEETDFCCQQVEFAIILSKKGTTSNEDKSKKKREANVSGVMFPRRGFSFFLRHKWEDPGIVRTASSVPPSCAVFVQSREINQTWSSHAAARGNSRLAKTLQWRQNTRGGMYGSDKMNMF